MREDDSDTDGPMLHKDEDEEDEPPPSKHNCSLRRLSAVV